MIDIKEFKQIYCYESYLEFLKSKKVREAQGTLLEFATDEDIVRIKKEDIKDISFLNPTDEAILKHQQFAVHILFKLQKENPKDDFLKELSKEENIAVLVSYNWYTKYGIEYNK